MPAADVVRPTYRAVLGDREYRALFAADGLSVVGDQVTRIAAALLVFDRTASPLAASATYAASYLTWLVGGPLLSALADRVPRRSVLIGCDLLRALVVAGLALPGLSVPAVFALLVLAGLLSPPFEAARSALLADVLEGERYAVGNALSTAVGNAGQLVGFVAGGALVVLLGTSGALLVDAATFVASAALVAAFIRRRPAPERPAATTGLLHELGAGARHVRATPELRSLLGWAVLSAGVAIPAEGLAVVVATATGGGALAAGVLTAALPGGYLLGAWLLLRRPPAARRRLFPALVLLTALCLAATPLAGATAAVLVLWTAAGVGTALQLVANSDFVQAVPPHLRGRAFGVAGTALVAAQGAVLLAAGALAERTGAADAVGLVGALGALAVVLVLARRAVRPQDLRRNARGGP